MIPSCDQTGTPRHFHSSTTSGTACLISARTWPSVLPRQSPNSLIRESISREGDSSLVATLFFITTLFFILFAPHSADFQPRYQSPIIRAIAARCDAGTLPAAPLGGIGQHEQVQTGDQE